MGDSDVLLCPPVTLPPAVSAVARTCTECGAAVWVSLTMAPVVDAHEVRPWCNGCVEATGQPVELRQHPRQAANGQTADQFDEMAAGILENLRGGGDG